MAAIALLWLAIVAAAGQCSIVCSQQCMVVMTLRSLAIAAAAGQRSIGTPADSGSRIRITAPVQRGSREQEGREGRQQPVRCCDGAPTKTLQGRTAAAHIKRLRGKGGGISMRLFLVLQSVENYL